jgi:hypothetical protein
MHRTHTLPRGSMPVGDGLCFMSDAEYHGSVDTSPPIGVAYARLGRVSSHMLRACEQVRVFGARPALRKRAK